jgi:hypothetical protein
MDDDLIVTFIVRVAVFISVWVATTGFHNRKGASTEALCTGIFNDHDQIMNPELTPDKLPQPYNPLLKWMAVAILFFMASVTYRRKKNSFSDDNKAFLRRPKDLESTLLNFAVLILLLINVIGYNLYIRGQVHYNQFKRSFFKFISCRYLFNFLFRMPSNQMALYPKWLIVYVLRVIVPMLILIIIAVKILLKSGREIQRAFEM